MKSKWTKILLGIFFYVAIVSYGIPAQGAIINVPGTFSKIQDAITASVDGDTILVDVSKSPYVENIVIQNKQIILKASGDVKIDGNQTGSVIEFVNDKGSTLNGFRIVNGLAQYGGGIYCENSSPTITNCTITSNSAAGARDSSGGGIECYNSSPTISDCAISGNTAIGNQSSGGGIICENSSPTINNCTISNNSASYGGGIEFYNGSSATISNCTINGNSATSSDGSGGGIECDNSSPAISDCIISNNSAGYGGGIECCNGSSAEITNCTISGNSATGAFESSGGGIECDGSSPTIIDCIISGNLSEYGAGIEVYQTSSAQITNCTITGNISSGDGGGIECDLSGARPTITNCTISNNSSNSSGGGIMCWDGGSPTVVNSILWGNEANGKPNEISLKTGSLVTVTYSDIQGGWTGTGNINADPLFVGTGDYHLTANSPCIDAGTTSMETPDHDIDGDSRPQGTGIDMGSDEYKGQPAVPEVFIFTDKSSYTTGETTYVSVQSVKNGVTVSADVYIRLVLPNGAVLYYPGWKPTANPIVRSWNVMDLGPKLLFNYTFRGNEPQGQYTLEIYLTEPGTTNIIGHIGSAMFTFSR